MCFRVPASCTSVLFILSFVKPSVSTMKSGHSLKASSFFTQSPGLYFHVLRVNVLGQRLSLESQISAYKVTEK